MVRGGDGVIIFRYINGNSIVDIAEKVNIAPCLMARIIIQMHVSHLSPGIIESNLKSTTSSYLRDPGLIEDERLSREVAECVQVRHILRQVS